MCAWVCYSCARKTFKPSELHTFSSLLKVKTGNQKISLISAELNWIQFIFIYTAFENNRNHYEALYRNPEPDRQTSHSGKETLPCTRKKPPPGPGSYADKMKREKWNRDLSAGGMHRPFLSIQHLVTIQERNFPHAPSHTPHPSQLSFNTLASTQASAGALSYFQTVPSPSTV